VQSGTGTEATTGVAYGAVGTGTRIRRSLPARTRSLDDIAAAVDKEPADRDRDATITDGNTTAFYMSGFYNTTTKTSMRCVGKDPVGPPAITRA